MRRSGNGPQLRDGVVVYRSSQTKVGDGDAFNTLFEQNVFGFDVAMDQSLFMSSRQTGSDLRADPQHFHQRQCPSWSSRFCSEPPRI